MTIPQEAIEAAARVMKPRQFEPNYTPLGMWSDLEQMHEIAELDRDMTRGRVRDILAAAEPHLRKKWEDELERAMFKVESVHHFGFGEYGIKCLCGFESSRSRSRTEHITQAVRNLLEGAGE